MKRLVNWFWEIIRLAPFLVPAALAVFGAITVPLLLAGQLRLIFALPLGLVATACAWWIIWRHAARLKFPGSLKEQNAVGLAAVVLVVGWTVFNLPYAAQNIIVHRDPAIYAVSGEWLKDHKSLKIKSPNTFGPVAQTDSAGFEFTSEHPDTLYAQGSHYLDIVLGLSGRIIGTSFMLRLNVVIGGLALLALYGATRCYVKPRWALAATGLLAVSLPMIYFSRDSYSEPLSLLLIMGSLSLIWMAQYKPTRQMWLLAGLTGGAATLTRIDAYLVVAALAAFAMLKLVLADRNKQRAVLSDILWFGAGMAAISTLGWMDLSALSASYYHNTRPQFIDEILLTGLIVIAGLVVAVAKSKAIWDKAAVFVSRWYKPAVIVTIILLGIFFISRPLWFKGMDGQQSPLVAALQTAAHQPVEPRSYAEMTPYWIMWYAGPALAVLAVVGFTIAALRIVKKNGLIFAAPVLVMAFTALVYMYKPSISPDQIWAARRFLPVVFPGACLFAAIAAETIWERYFKTARRQFKSLALGTMALALLAPPLFISSPFLTTQTYGSELTQIRQICGQLPPKAAILLVGTSAFNMTQTAATFCQVPAMRIPKPSQADLQTAAKSAFGRGYTPVVMVFDGDKQTLPNGSHLSVGSIASYQELSIDLYHPPRLAQTSVNAILMGRLQPDGSVKFL